VIICQIFFSPGFMVDTTCALCWFHNVL